MLHSPILKSHFGKHYSLQTRNQTIVRGPLTPEIFWDLHYTRQFIRSLWAPEGYWRRLAQQFDTLSRAYSKSDIEIEQQVCQLLLTGRLQIFEVEVSNMVEHPPEKRVIKDKAGVIYRFSPASVLLTSQPRETQHFSDVTQAQQFLDGLNASEEQLATIAQELEIVSSPSVNRTELLTAISKSLAKGEVVITVDSVSTAPSSEKTVEKADANAPGNRSVGLGPAIEVAVNDVMAQTECSCTVVTLVATCEHNRSSGSTNVLQIVPLPNQIRSEEYELMGVKVTLQEEFGGSDTVQCQLELANNQSGSCFNIIDINNQSSNSSETEFLIEAKEQKRRSKWLIDATPERFSIKGHGCDQRLKDISIESFPSQYYTVQADISVFGDWVKKVNKGWEKWGEKFFSVSPIELKPKLTGPAGTFSASWGWKESSDWRAYYDVAGNFGVNPILGVEIKIVVSFVKLGMTAMGIPPGLSHLAAEHLADINLSAAAKCSGSLTGSPHAKFYSDGTEEIIGEGKLIIAGAVELQVSARVGSDYVVAAYLQGACESKISAEDIVNVDKSGMSLQNTIMLAPFIGRVTVKVVYLKVRTKKKEKKWKPWDEIEIYKSDKIKILPR